MALRKGHRTNFNTLLRAAKAGDLALVECTDAKTGENRAVLAAIGRDKNGDYLVTPFGHLSNGNPYEEYVMAEADNG